MASNDLTATTEDTVTNAVDVQTKHVTVGDVSYAYRELRPAHLADPTPVLFLASLSRHVGRLGSGVCR